MAQNNLPPKTESSKKFDSAENARRLAENSYDSRRDDGEGKLIAIINNLTKNLKKSNEVTEEMSDVVENISEKTKEIFADSNMKKMLFKLPSQDDLDNILVSSIMDKMPNLDFMEKTEDKLKNIDTGILEKTESLVDYAKRASENNPSLLTNIILKNQSNILSTIGDYIKNIFDFIPNITKSFRENFGSFIDMFKNLDGNSVMAFIYKGVDRLGNYFKEFFENFLDFQERLRMETIRNKFDGSFKNFHMPKVETFAEKNIRELKEIAMPKVDAAKNYLKSAFTITNILSVLTKVGLGLAPLVATGTFLYLSKNTDQLSGILQDLNHIYVTRLIPAWNYLLNEVFIPFTNNVTKLGNDLYDNVVKWWNSSPIDYKQTFKDFLDSLELIGQMATDVTRLFLQSGLPPILDALGRAFKNGVNLLKTVSKGIGGIFGYGPDGDKGLLWNFNNIVNGIYDTLYKGIDNIATLAINLTGLSSFFDLDDGETIGGRIWRFFNDLNDQVNGYIQSLHNGLFGFFDDTKKSVMAWIDPLTKQWDDGIKFISDTITGTRNFIVGIFTNVKSMVSGVYNGISNFISNFDLEKTVTNLYNTISNDITNFVNNVIGFFGLDNVSFKDIKDKINNLFSTVAGVFDLSNFSFIDINNKINSFVTSVIGVFDFENFSFGNIKSKINYLFSTIADIFNIDNFSFTDIVVKVNNFISSITSIFNVENFSFSNIKQKINSFISSVENIFDDITGLFNTDNFSIKNIEDKINSLFTTIKNLFDFKDFSYDSIKSKINDMFNAVTDKFTSLPTVIGDFLDKTEIGTEIKNNIIEIYNKMKNTFSDIKDQVVKFIKDNNPITSIKDKIHQMIDTIVSMIPTRDDLKSMAYTVMDSIPYFPDFIKNRFKPDTEDSTKKVSTPSPTITVVAPKSDRISKDGLSEKDFDSRFGSPVITNKSKLTDKDINFNERMMPYMDKKWDNLEKSQSELADRLKANNNVIINNRGGDTYNSGSGSKSRVKSGFSTRPPETSPYNKRLYGN